MASTQLSVSISLAETEDARAEALRLRQLVFGDELGDNRYSKGDFQRDSLDTEDSIILTARLDSESRTIGMTRLSDRRKAPFISDECYKFERLAEMLGTTEKQLLESIFLVDRTCVLSDYRRLGVFRRLISATEKEVSQRGGSVLIAAIAPENHRSQNAFRKLGFSECYSLVGGRFLLFARDLSS